MNTQNQKLRRKSSMQLRTLHADAIAAWVPELSRLRIKVFREYPYLYEGSETEESEYLQSFVEARDSVLILALDGEAVVGASTGMPLDQSEALFQTPWIQAGYEPQNFFYFAESVLLPAYRGCGIGRDFMQKREDFAVQLGRFTHATLCGVVRPGSAAPQSYRSPEHLWKRCGFESRPDLEALLSWTEIGQSVETEKRMRFWWKALRTTT